jgi:pyruvate,water dikinase
MTSALLAAERASDPDPVSWAIQAKGAYTRQLRFGEWIGAPVTPLFESWLLTTLERELHAKLRREIGQRAPEPHHVIVNGWYFYSLNWLSPGALLRSLPAILSHAIRSPRKVAGVIPPTVRHSFPVMERIWRTEIQPRYRATVASAEARVERVRVSELPGLVDELAAGAAEYFFAIAALGGAAYKLEMNLAIFYTRHLAPTLGGSHLPLVTGVERPADPASHAVTSLDWVEPIPPVAPATMATDGRERVVGARKAAEAAAIEVLAASPGKLRMFRRTLADAQHLIPIRVEQVRELPIAWPVMRRAVLRIGEALVDQGVIEDPDDVFFLTKAEVLAALAGKPPSTAVDVEARRATRAKQARLSPPLMVGRLNGGVRRLWESFPKMVGAKPSGDALVTGTPASAGRVTGLVRVVRGPAGFDQLLPGEILVAPVTAPAWTPLFTLASAVVTDVGGVAAHASVIAREYGIPAIVGCGNATAALRTGMRVTVDGSTGNVLPAQP